MRTLERLCGLEPGSPERDDVYYFMAYKAKLHRAMPEAAYAAEFEFVDEEPLEGEVHYRVRVEQRKGPRRGDYSAAAGGPPCAWRCSRNILSCNGLDCAPDAPARRPGARFDFPLAALIAYGAAAGVCLPSPMPGLGPWRTTN